METKLSMSVYAKPTCNMLVLCNNHVCYWNKKFYFVNCMLYKRLFSFIFSPLKGLY